MNKKDFDTAIKRLQISDRGIDMARRVLVGGETNSAVAADFEVTVAAVSHHVTRVWRSHVEAQEIPPGHERVCAVLPTEKAEIVRTWERESNRRNRP